MSVCDAPGHQCFPSVVNNGCNGAIFVWQDERLGIGDIYGQNINQVGQAQWVLNGISICAESHTQELPNSASDRNGGVFVVWQDHRGPQWDIYMQRVDSLGSQLWTAGGIAVSTASQNQTYPTIISDDLGMVYLSWQSNQLTGYEDIFVTKCNQSGNLVWGLNGIAVCPGSTNQRNQTMVDDGFGGLIIAWVDMGPSSSDIHSQRINAAGQLDWEAPGKSICTLEGYQEQPVIIKDDEDGVYISWAHNYSGCLKLNSDGFRGYPHPRIQAVSDIPADQGGWLRIYSLASEYDLVGTTDYPVTGYNVWRRIDGAVMQNSDVLLNFDDLTKDILIAEPGGKDTAGLRIDCALAREMGFPPGSWESLGFHAATLAAEYIFTVPTRNDSTPGQSPYEVYVLTAHTTTPAQFFVSSPDSGFSVDNLAPDTPQGLAGDGNVNPSGLYLFWDENTEPDLAHYSLYRGSTDDFVPGSANLISIDPETEYLDVEWIPGIIFHYKLSAVDRHGNESSYIAYSSEDVVPALVQEYSARILVHCVELTWRLSTSVENSDLAVQRNDLNRSGAWEQVEGEILYFDQYWRFKDNELSPGATFRYMVSLRLDNEEITLFQTEAIEVPGAKLALDQNYPNPFNPQTTISYSMPGQGRAKLVIYNSQGKHVTTLISEVLPPGPGTVAWDGTDSTGAPVASGVYFARLETPRGVRTQKLVVAR